MIALGVVLPDDRRAQDLVSVEVEALIREHAATGSADAIEGVRREVLTMLSDGPRAAPVDLMVLDELRRRAMEVGRALLH